MDVKLVTVARYQFPPEAYLAKSQLEAEEVTCFVKDEYVVGANELYPNGVGGIKLQVPEPEVERAREVLTAFSGSADVLIDEWEWMEGEAVYTCPKCGARDIIVERVGKKFSISAILLLGIPLLFRKNSLVCGACGHKWKGY